MQLLQRLFVQSGFAVDYEKFKRTLTILPVLSAAAFSAITYVLIGDPILAVLMAAVAASVTFGSVLLRLVAYVSARRSHFEYGSIYLFSFIVPLLAVGSPPNVIFRRALESEQDRVIAEELALILRDVELLGLDPLTALMRSAERVPSQTYREMINVMVNAIKLTKRVDLAVLGRLEWLIRLRSIKLASVVRSLTIMFEAYLVMGLIAPIITALVAMMLSPIAPLQILGVTMRFEDILALATIIYVPIINAVFYILFDQMLRMV